MIKTTGAEFKRFYDDLEVWTDETYHDDVVLSVNDFGSTEHWDADLIKPADKIVIESGCMVYEGDKTRDICAVFKAWRKKQTVQVFSVEIPNNHIESFKKIVKTLKGRIA